MAAAKKANTEAVLRAIREAEKRLGIQTRNKPRSATLIPGLLRWLNTSVRDSGMDRIRDGWGLRTSTHGRRKARGGE